VLKKIIELSIAEVLKKQKNLTKQIRLLLSIDKPRVLSMLRSNLLIQNMGGKNDKK
jgi:hypothetical protein